MASNDMNPRQRPSTWLGVPLSRLGVADIVIAAALAPISGMLIGSIQWLRGESYVVEPAYVGMALCIFVLDALGFDLRRYPLQSLGVLIAIWTLASAISLLFGGVSLLREGAMIQLIPVLQLRYS